MKGRVTIFLFENDKPIVFKTISENEYLQLLVDGLIFFRENIEGWPAKNVSPCIKKEDFDRIFGDNYKGTTGTV